MEFTLENVLANGFKGSLENDKTDIPFKGDDAGYEYYATEAATSLGEANTIALLNVYTMENYSVSTEGAKEVLKKIWDGFVAFLKKIGEFFQNLIRSIINFFQSKAFAFRVKKLTEEQVKAAIDSDNKFKSGFTTEDTVKVSKSVVSDIMELNSTESIEKTLEDLFDMDFDDDKFSNVLEASLFKSTSIAVNGIGKVMGKGSTFDKIWSEHNSAEKYLQFPMGKAIKDTLMIPNQEEKTLVEIFPYLKSASPSSILDGLKERSKNAKSLKMAKRIQSFAKLVTKLASKKKMSKAYDVELSAIKTYTKNTQRVLSMTTQMLNSLSMYDMRYCNLILSAALKSGQKDKKEDDK